MTARIARTAGWGLASCALTVSPVSARMPASITHSDDTAQRFKRALPVIRRGSCFQVLQLLLMDEVAEIKERLGVAEVVASYVQLKPAGRNMKGVCPFHNEKTPSMMVSAEKGIWHCFGCGEGGDIFKFVMKMEGLDFRQALEVLAKRAGVELKSRGPSNTKLKDRLKAAMTLAVKYYQLSLTKNPRALDYMKQRGLTKQSILDFRLGYAPVTQSGLTTFMTKQGFTIAELNQAGLTGQRDNRTFDMFRGRITFPISNERGEPVGIAARILDPTATGPKYFNTPQTLIYDKGRVLYGFHLAKEAVKQHDELVIVEGNMDVVASHQAGVKQVVASSGTALTLDQLKMVGRLTKNVKLAFDQDAAGLRATERAIDLSQQLNLTLSVVDMAGAKDPDELIKQKPELWQTAVSEAKYVMDWLFERHAAGSDLASALGKRSFTDQIIPVLKYLRDPVEQEHYIKLLAERVDGEPAVIKEKLSQAEPKPVRQMEAKEKADPLQLSREEVVEENLLALNLVFPDLRASLADMDEELFSRSEHQAICKFLKARPAATSDQIARDLTELSDYVKILSLKGEEEYSEIGPQDRSFEAFHLAKELVVLATRRRHEEITHQIKEAERAGRRDLAQKLMAEHQALSAKVKEL